MEILFLKFIVSLMLQQAVEVQIENATEEQDKMRLCSIRDRANVTYFTFYQTCFFSFKYFISYIPQEMLESIKHTIVLLQIAKVFSISIFRFHLTFF